MDHELITTEGGTAIDIVSGGGITDVIKPLIEEIKLFDTYIAGTSFIEDRSVFKKISIGDNLILRREENKFDDKAILILTNDEAKLGYVPEKDNIIFSRLMDAGKKLIARITGIDVGKESFISISIDIYLVDF